MAMWCFNNAKIFASDVFLFLVCFVDLQVMTKGTWWVCFWDGVQSQLFNENFSWILWIMFLQEDRQDDFEEARRWDDEEYIWCKLRKWRQVFWWWKKTKLLDFLSTEKCVLDLDFRVLWLDRNITWL